MVSSMRMNREMTNIIRGAEDAKVVVFPRSVRTVEGNSFKNMASLRQVILNEGLETLGENYDNEFEHDGPFASSSVERIRLPSTLKRLGNNALCGCEQLKSVELPEGLETIGDGCFYGCGI